MQDGDKAASCPADERDGDSLQNPPGHNEPDQRVDQHTAKISEESMGSPDAAVIAPVVRKT
ncbi:hypothetical protein OG963_14520 [Streptomyces sp. NBC_01707]|uniref:hypothetical protein n=1 Tax=Streptomyces sp. NBC_01707 TaxID=2975914 RepID=UPI00352E66EA